MTGTKPHTASLLAQWLIALALVPLLVLMGCDSGSNGDDIEASDQTPEASFTTSFNEFTVSFDASGSTDPDGGEISSYAWEFGDGATASGAQVSHTYDMAGDYDVTLTVVDDEGTDATATETVTVDPDQITVRNDITSNTTWSGSKTYILDGLIFVDPGATLTIEPGTVVKGLQSSNITTGDGASALIVRRGASIDADGASDNPIVFTSELDDVTDPNDLTSEDRELWGGVILLGDAPTNEPTQNTQIEGIPDSENALYGGDNPQHDIGTFRYVSIRHGGFSISGVEGDEINGLTMGGVGNQSTIEYVEIFANFDDGFEWFGGTVHTKYLVAAFCGDDGFDYDQGFQGTGQYWFVVQNDDTAGRAGEHDGGDTDETGTPFALPIVANATYIGSGVNNTNIDDEAIIFRDNAGAEYYNSIFTDFPTHGPTVEDLSSGGDSRQQLEGGNLVLDNNVWFGFGDGNDAASIIPQDFVRTAIGADQILQDPELGGISRTNDGGLDPRPGADFGTNTPTAAADFADAANRSADLTTIFDDVSYYGAFDPSASSLWTDGWTALSTEGYTAN